MSVPSSKLTVLLDMLVPISACLYIFKLGNWYLVAIFVNHTLHI